MDYRSMGQRIRHSRKKQGFTQANLAEQVGVSVSFIGHLERGTRIPSIETIAAIAGVLDLSLDHIILGTAIDDSKTPYPNTSRVLGEVISKLATLYNALLQRDFSKEKSNE